MCKKKYEKSLINGLYKDRVFCNICVSTRLSAPFSTRVLFCRVRRLQYHIIAFDKWTWCCHKYHRRVLKGPNLHKIGYETIMRHISGKHTFCSPFTKTFSLLFFDGKGTESLRNQLQSVSFDEVIYSPFIQWQSLNKKRVNYLCIDPKYCMAPK